MMFFILLLLGLALGGSGTAKADLVVKQGSDDETYRWVTVTDPGTGMTAFGIWRAGEDQQVWRSECWRSVGEAEARVNALLAAPFNEYTMGFDDLPAGAVGPGVDCGPRVAHAAPARRVLPGQG